MGETEQSNNQVKVAIPIRVRGMSTEHKFFDETTETARVGSGLLVTRLRHLVDLETELFVINTKNDAAGTFRVLWLNTEDKDGWHDVGMELVEAEGDLWEIPFSAEEEEVGRRTARAWLECQRCHEKLLTDIPEADDEFLHEGFRIARTCQHCKATTPWEFVPAEPAEAEPAAAGATGVTHTMRKRPYIESRAKGRAPIETDIKVIRAHYGTILEDICKTVNVSRHGAYFLTKETYAVGERVSVVLHYKEGDVSIPVPAYVVRVEPAKDGTHQAVAIRLETARR
jgi:hypothetical protein